MGKEQNRTEKIEKIKLVLVRAFAGDDPFYIIGARWGKTEA